jgi:hypothetical protein
MRADRVRQGMVVLALVATVALNALANILPLNNQTTGDIANRYPVRFIPANYVFSIWSLIYIGLIAYAVYQALPGQRTNKRLQHTGWLFVLTCVFNSAWLVLWHYEFFILTIPVMIALFATLFAIYVALRRGGDPPSAVERLVVFGTFSVYLGWITVATITNIVTVLYQQGWNGWGISAEAWTVVLLVVGVGIAALFTRNKPDVAYVAVLLWAFAGIAVKQSDAPVVVIAAVVATLAIAALLVVKLLRGGSHGRAVQRAA